MEYQTWADDPYTPPVLTEAQKAEERRTARAYIDTHLKRVNGWVKTFIECGGTVDLIKGDDGQFTADFS
jgi:hypothetical protein